MPHEYKSHNTPLYGKFVNISGLQYCFEPAFMFINIPLPSSPFIGFQNEKSEMTIFDWSIIKTLSGFKSK